MNELVKVLAFIMQFVLSSLMIYLVYNVFRFKPTEKQFKRSTKLVVASFFIGGIPSNPWFLNSIGILAVTTVVGFILSAILVYIIATALKRVKADDGSLGGTDEFS